MTLSPPMSESKLTDASIPLRWKKYSLPSAASINPKPRSDTTFLMVPVETVVSFALEPGMSVRSCSGRWVLTTARTCRRQAGRHCTRLKIEQSSLRRPPNRPSTGLDVRADLDEIPQHFDWQATRRDLGRRLGWHR